MKKGLVIDANLLLLVVIGMLEDGIHIKSSKRFSSYNKNDLLLLLDFINKFQHIYGHHNFLITPYLATEVSNLIDLKGSLRYEAFKVAKIIFSECTQIDVGIKEDIQLHEFITHGITDASLVSLVKDYFVLTNDNKLLNYLYMSNYKNVIPFAGLKEFMKCV